MHIRPGLEKDAEAIHGMIYECTPPLFPCTQHRIACMGLRDSQNAHSRLAVFEKEESQVPIPDSLVLFERSLPVGSK